MNTRLFVTVLSKGIWIFSLLTWVYIVIDVHVNPEIIERHYILATLVPIREDFMAVISFALAGTFFILWEYLRRS